MLTFWDLCSGIGGGRTGFENAGCKCIGYSDTSRLAKITYNYLYDTSDEQFWPNLKRIDLAKVQKTPDIIVAGFPCQSFSVIGRKEGFNDIRGQIIFHIASLIKQVRPKYFLLENVAGLITHNKGETIKTIDKLLTDCGYHVERKKLLTLDYGIPQNRKRVYFIGIRKDLYAKPFSWPSPSKDKRSIVDFFLFKEEITEENLFYFKKYLSNDVNKQKLQFDEVLSMGDCILDTRMNDLRIYTDKMPTLRSQRDGIYYLHNHRLFQLTGAEALLFQGFSKEQVKKVENKVSNRHLLMQAGNAMSINVIEALARQIVLYDKQGE